MNNSISSDIFRAYDIRGIVGHGIDDRVIALLGKAIGSEALDQGITTLVIGYDARLTSSEYHRVLVEAVLGTGCHVTDIGMVPTPLLYFATHTLKADSGIMITGSHNPADYNGLKIVFHKQSLSDTQIARFRQRIEDLHFHEGCGQSTYINVIPAYLERIHRDLRLFEPAKVVIDAGNGVAGLVAPALFRTFGFEVVELYCEPDGHFPNHHPDPTVAANRVDLTERVLAEKADLGIALDGDGDRACLVTSTGRVLDADKLLMSFVLDILPAHPDAPVVFDVKTSFHLPRLVKAHGGVPVQCKSGHSFVKKKMTETSALLGGEYSAHLFFRHRWYGFDDGLYCAARFIELMQKYGASADSLLDLLPASVSTPELGIEVDEDEKFALMARLADNLDFDGASISTLDGIRADFDYGWGLIRASNTTPRLVLRFEADTDEHLEAIKTRFRTELCRLAPGLALPF